MDEMKISVNGALALIGFQITGPRFANESVNLVGIN